MNRTFLLIDANYLCYRARYSMPQDLSYAGQPTAILYAFLKEITALQNQFQTSHILFCFDSHNSKRREIYPDYKANRHKKELTEEELKFEIAFRNQIAKLRKEYLPEIGWRNIYQVKGYESDDLLAMLAYLIALKSKYKSLKNEDKIVIVTSDHDLYQCIRHNITIYNPKERKELTLQGFKQQFGIMPMKWDQVKAIAGCATDNIKGVKGVGEITALKYVRGELKEKSKAYQAIISKEGQEIIARNKMLVSLPMFRTPVLKVRKDELSIEGWNSVVTKLGFQSMKNEDPFPWRRAK